MSTAIRLTEFIWMLDLRHQDPNRRIAAVQSLGRVDKGWTEDEEEQVVAELMRLLGDESISTYSYGGFMCDDEEPTVRVCDAAERALLSIFGRSTARADRPRRAVDSCPAHR